MNPKYLNKEIYEKAKKEIDKEHKVHSAYKSMALIKRYKELGGKIDESKSKKGTTRWLREDWRNLTPYAFNGISLKDTPKCGVKGKKQGDLPSICRPLKKINENTPKTADKYTKSQMRNAVELKKKGKRIMWEKL